MHESITLSGSKHVFNKVYAVNKWVSKYVVLALFLHKISIVSLILSGYEFVLSLLTLRAFSVARPLNARPYI